MTIYFREHDWKKLQDHLHRLQQLLPEDSDTGLLVDESLGILDNQDRDSAMEELQEEKAIAAKGKIGRETILPISLWKSQKSNGKRYRLIPGIRMR